MCAYQFINTEKNKPHYIIRLIVIVCQTWYFVLNVIICHFWKAVW